MSLVEAYRFDETLDINPRTGQLAAGADLTVSAGVASIIAGKLGNATFGMNFTLGKTGGIGSLGALRSGNLTIAYWFRRDAAAYNFELTLKHAATGAGFYLADSNGSGSSATAFGTGAASVSPTLATEDVWCFRTITWDLVSKAIRAYVDADLVDQAVDGSVAFPNDFDSLTIVGAQITIDQLMIYNERLTPTGGTNTLDQLYNNGDAFDPTAAVASLGRRRNRRRMTAG